MDIIKLVPVASQAERKISSSILLDTVLYVFDPNVRKNIFLSISRADMKGRRECASTEPRFELEELFPQKIQGLTHRGPWVCSKILQNVYAYSSIIA